MFTHVHSCGVAARRYERRRAEKTPLHKIVSAHLESWLEWRDQAERPVPGYVGKELRGCLQCGILCFGFGRTVCSELRPGVCRAVLLQGARGILAEIERLLSAAADATIDAVARPRLGAPPAFLPARPITQAELATVTERVRCRVIR